MAEPDDKTDTSIADGEAATANTWDPATAEPSSAMATWRSLERARAEAQETYESQIAAFKAEYEERVAPIDEQIATVEEWFAAHAAETGADAFDSDAGKVTISVRETPKISDAESFFSWAASSNNVGLLQKRISVTQFRDFMKANPDQTPPGVTLEAVQSVKFKPAE